MNFQWLLRRLRKTFLRGLVESKLLMKVRIAVEVFQMDLASRILKRQAEMRSPGSEWDITDSFRFYGFFDFYNRRPKDGQC
jgi:hypothetical protein